MKKHQWPLRAFGPWMAAIPLRAVFLQATHERVVLLRHPINFCFTQC
jgi:hypothetical protein